MRNYRFSNFYLSFYKNNFNLKKKLAIKWVRSGSRVGHIHIGLWDVGQWDPLLMLLTQLPPSAGTGSKVSFGSQSIDEKYMD